MPSPRHPLGWLLVKDLRELTRARAWWMLVISMGPLTGAAFIDAVTTYAELSGYGGTTEGVGEAFAPLVGIWSPTFSAAELAAAFLLPFVAIRLVAGDLHSGTLLLELQRPAPSWWRLASKSLVLLGGWLVASLPLAAAVVLWATYGGHLQPAELAAVTAGHLLNALLTVALASAAASATDHPATAAIATLTVTVGTWLLAWAGAVQGGLWEWAAGYTPAAMVAQFQHGLVRLDIVCVALVLSAAGLLVSAVWVRLGVPRGRRARETAAVLVVTLLLTAAATRLTPSWDLSENRMNSFRRGDEALLATITAPLAIDVHLAAADPRRVDFERLVLARLRRIHPDLQVRYMASTTTGLMEQSRDDYGEIHYRVGRRHVMSRATTPDGALEALYEAAGLTPPPEAADDVFRGYPLTTPPRGAAVFFYGAWPLAVSALAFRSRRTS